MSISTTPATLARSEDGQGVRNTQSWPVIYAATAGGLMLIFSLVIWARWIFSSNFRPVNPGPDSIPTWNLVALHGLEVVGGALVIWFFYGWVIRPWRREGHLTSDGLILLALPFVWFWDPGLNYLQNWFSYNAHLLNMGSWSSEVPGWVAPNQARFVEPLAVGLSYVFWVFGFMIISRAIFDRVKRRWPTMSTAVFALVAFAICSLLDALGEVIGLMIGWFAYPGAMHFSTVFGSTRWKFPLIEPLLFGGIQLFLWVSVRYFRDEAGHSVYERGVDTLKVSDRAKTGVRFLAIYTGLTVPVLIINLLVQAHATHPGPYPHDMPSYLTTTCPDFHTNPASCLATGTASPGSPGH